MTTITIQMTKTTYIPSVSDKTNQNETLESLVGALRSRQAGALEAVIKKTEKPCYHLALSILKDPELSKDALQEAYFTVYRRVGQLREPAAFKAWLFRIVTHSCHDILRKRGKEIETDLSDREDLLATSIQTDHDPSHSVPNQEQIRNTFQTLLDIDRQALALREVCSLSYEEMSQVLKIPIGTVRSRLAKARQRFIQAYRKEQTND